MFKYIMNFKILIIVTKVNNDKEKLKHSIYFHNVDPHLRLVSKFVIL